MNVRRALARAKDALASRLHRERRAALALRLRPWPAHAAAAGAAGVTLGVGSGLPLAEGDIRPLAAAVLLTATIPFVARILPPRYRQAMGSVLLVALTARFAAAVLIHEGSVAVGHDGWVTGDDWNYAEFAWGVASWLKGTPYAGYFPPNWNTDVYLFGTYVYLHTAVFFLFGRQVLLMDFLNAWALVVAATLMFDLARRIFGDRSAVIASLAVMWYPSIFVWSVLNLKDALAILLITATFWTFARFQRAPTWLWLIAIFVVLYPMQGLRRYIYLLLLLALAVAFAAALPRLAREHRRLGIAGAVVAATLFVFDFNSASWFGRIDLDLLENFRHGMATGARTGFQESPPIRLVEGESYVIRTPPPKPTAFALATTPPPTPRPGAGGGTPEPPPPTLPPTPTPEPSPTCTPSVRQVVRGANLIVTSDPVPPLPPPGSVFVCPGDIILVGTDTTPGPQAARPLEVDTSARFVIRPNPVGSTDRALIRSFDSVESTLTYLPKGIAYALMAPFPWAVQRRIELLTVPDMLLWYVVMVLASVTVWRMRSRARELAGLFVFVVVLVIALALVEGNYGTLYRHRAMLVPSVILLAAPTVAAMLARERRNAPAAAGAMSVRTGSR